MEYKNKRKTHKSVNHLAFVLALERLAVNNIFNTIWYMFVELDNIEQMKCHLNGPIIFWLIECKPYEWFVRACTFFYYLAHFSGRFFRPILSVVHIKCAYEVLMIDHNGQLSVYLYILWTSNLWKTWNVFGIFVSVVHMQINGAVLLSALIHSWIMRSLFSIRIDFSCAPFWCLFRIPPERTILDTFA